jgi:type 1 glutamine amidotransferase
MRPFDSSQPFPRHLAVERPAVKTILSFSHRTFLAAVTVLAVACSVRASDQPKKLLVVSVTTGFRHSSIATAERILEKLGKESGAFTVDFVRQPEGEPPEPARPKDDAGDAEKKRYQEALVEYRTARAAWDAKIVEALGKLSPANLKNYDGVVFANTTGDLPLPDPQGFIDWVKSGKAFIGMHSASDTFHHFRPYVEMLGAEFKGHGPQVEVVCLNEDAQHAACKDLPPSWTVFDEIYQMTSYERGQVHGLLSLDKHPNDKTPGHYPISWCKQVGKGRVFYTSLGHREDMWDDDPGMQDRKNAPEVSRAYQKHVLAGIQWALGLAPGDAAPQHQ